MPFPNFIIGGPPKTGTTSLFSWLSEHPEVCASSVKETYHFYSRSEEKTGNIETFSAQHIEDYKSYFKDCAEKKIICEATPSYLYSRSAIQSLRQINPNIKVLFVLREPADRLYSEYSFHKYKTKRFSGTFQSYVTEFQLNQSNYSAYLMDWVEAFGIKNIALLRFSDLEIQPNQVMESICDFLEIDRSFFSQIDLQPKNQTTRLRNRKLHLTMLKLVKLVPKKILNTLSPIYYKLNSQLTPPKSVADEVLFNQLRLQFANYEKDLLKEFGMCFLHLNQKVS